jgi:hypothetical protein
VIYKLRFYDEGASLVKKELEETNACCGRRMCAKAQILGTVLCLYEWKEIQPDWRVELDDGLYE